jgi:hypothetical protein
MIDHLHPLMKRLLSSLVDHLFSLSALVHRASTLLPLGRALYAHVTILQEENGLAQCFANACHQASLLKEVEQWTQKCLYIARLLHPNNTIHTDVASASQKRGASLIELGRHDSTAVLGKGSGKVPEIAFEPG